MSQVFDNDNQLKKDRTKPKYNPTDYYQKGAYIDCKDSVNAWCVAKILERCDDDCTLRINFDGWSQKWNEWLRFSSTKLAPFRKFSAGYTGQAKFAIRDWKFSISEVQMRTEKLKELIESNFDALKTPFQITQTIRGDEFIFVDSLLQYEYQNPKEELPYVFKHFEVCFQLYIHFLKLIPSYIPDYLEGITNIDSFLTNERIALILSFNEVSEMVNQIFGSSERLWTQFKNYDSEQMGISICETQAYAGKDINLVWTIDEKEEITDQQANPRKKYSKLICQLVNKFGEIGGIDEWIKVFNLFKEEEDAANYPNNIQLPPFRMMETLMKTLSTIHVYLNEDLKKSITPLIKDAILRRLRCISDRELKELDKDDLSRFIIKSQAFLVHYYSQDEVFTMTETAELDLDYRFLTCSFFEKKLRGITRINELAEKIDMYEFHSKNSSPSKTTFGLSQIPKHLSAKFFIEWIFQNKIIELILGDSIHTEIIKRCHEILKFVAKYETIPLSLLERLWNTCEGKHETTLVGLYDIIIEISGYLNSEGIQFLRKKIESIPNELQNEMTLNLIKGFAQNTLPRIDTIQTQNEEDFIDESKYNCINVLWNILLDHNKINVAISEMALNHLVHLLKQPSCQPLRKFYLFKCFENLKTRDSVSQSINLIHSILNGPYFAHREGSQEPLKLILEKLNERFDIIELVVSEFEHFYHQMVEASRKVFSLTDISEDPRMRTYLGKYSYIVNFNNRLIFLAYLTTNQAYELPLSFNQIERLWNLVVLHPIWDEDREYFFNWLSYKHEGQNFSRVNVVSKQLIEEFFKEILCNQNKMDFVDLSQNAFECFFTYFKVLNEMFGALRVEKASKFQILDPAYEGKEILWAMFFSCKNENTTKSIIDLLVDCNFQLGSNLDRKKKEIWENFIFTCLNYLKEGHEKKNEELISKAVLIMMHFFDKFEGKNRLEVAQENQTKQGYNIRVLIVLKPENITRSIIVNNQQTMGYVKELIADKFGFNLDEVEIFARGVVVEKEEDRFPVQNFISNEPFYIQKMQYKKNLDAGYHPKQLIADNAECLDLLFQLLSEDLQVVNIIWDLLMRLPVSEKTKKSLYEINDSWENLLGLKSMQQYRLLYCLQIIEEYLFDGDADLQNTTNKNQERPGSQFRDLQWSQKFYESSGLKSLANILLKSEITRTNSIISLKCLTIILRILNAFFDKFTLNDIYGKEAKINENEVAQKMVEIIYKVSEHSQSQESREGKIDQLNFVRIYNKQNNEYLRIPENLYYESEAVFYAQASFMKLVQNNTSLFTEIYQYSHLKNLLSIGLVESNNVYLRDKLSQGLVDLMIKFSKIDISTVLPPHHILLPILLENTLQKALDNQDKSEIFFRMLTSLISSVDIGEVKLDSDDLFYQLIEFLKLKRPMEKNQRDLDVVLHGVLLLLKGLFARYPEKAQKYGQEEGLVTDLLQSGLFEITKRLDRKQIPGPKCKNQYTRSAAFKLLIELAKDSNENLQEIINYIAPIHKFGKWRTKRYIDWNIVQKDNERSATGYVGLKNLGCICYMNSTIQQIYMIPSFRNAILESEDKQQNLVPKEDNLLYQLKCIFSALDNSEKEYFNPKNFCYAFKDWDGNPTNVFEQMDADEFFLLFMDRLENQIRGSKQEKFIKQHFGGVLSNELICKGCPHYSEREEPFLAVSLQVKNKKNIYQSLSAFVEGEMLEGDNAYFCAQCDKKVNTLRRVCLKKLPNHLMLVLKRFEFDYDTMAKVKVNDYCEFPTKLDLEPFTQQGLRKAEKAKEQENEEAFQDTYEEGDYPKSYFEYKLTGIVVHVGFADSGHYISLIQDQETKDESEDKKWYEFNDTDVRYFDPKDIPSETFGGQEKWGQYQSHNDSNREKIKNAYLLFYERIIPEEDHSQIPEVPQETPQKAKEEFKEEHDDIASISTMTPDKPPSGIKIFRSDRGPDIFKRPEIEPKVSEDYRRNYPHEFLLSVLEKNQIFQMHRNIFSKEYFEFMIDLVSQRSFTPNLKFNSSLQLNPTQNAKEYYDLELLKLGILFLLTTVIRDKFRTGILKLLPFIKEKLSQNLAASMWLLEMFSKKKIQLEFFLDCPIIDMRRFVVGLLSLAFKTIFDYQLQEDKEGILSVKETDIGRNPNSVMINFMNCCISLIFEAKFAGRDYTEFFRIFYDMAVCGYQVVNYMISKKVIGRFLDFFYEQVSPFNDFFRDMSDVHYQEPEQLDLGESHEEKKKVRSSWEEYMLRKKDKQVVESRAAQKSYLWKSLCYLLLHCRMNPNAPKSEWQIGDYNYSVVQKEFVLLTPEAKFIQKVIADSETKISYRNVAKLYSYLCYEEQAFTNTFIEAIKAELSFNDYYTFKAPFRCLSTLFTLKDSLSGSRLKQICSLLINLMKENQIYYLEMNAYISFLIKIAFKFERVQFWLLDNIDSWNWILTWLVNNPTPPLETSPESVFKLQRRKNVTGMNQLQYKMHEYKARSNLKLYKLQKIIKGEIIQSKDHWDSDDDLADHNFILKEKLDLDPRRNNQWHAAEVDTVLEEMINVTFMVNEKDKESLWLSKDTENIAPFGSMRIIQAEVEEESERVIIAERSLEKIKQEQNITRKEENRLEEKRTKEEGVQENPVGHG